MIVLIPVIKSDYLLAVLYILIIAATLVIKYEEKDLLTLIFGFFIMIFAEYFFVMTGVETFVRNSLLGVMPVWLPILWAAAFVAIKRAISVLI